MNHSRVTRADAPLATTIERAHNAPIVRARGVLSRSTAEKFERAVVRAIDEGSPDVILDLGGVHFIDCTGLRSLLRVANLSRGVGGELRLQRSSTSVQQAIEWGGLDRRLRWVE
jgi:anti-sigma B factor antagonist